MPTSYPSNLDDFDNPAPDSPTTNPSHALQHANANDAIEALEAKVGVDGSSDPASLDRKVSDHLGGGPNPHGAELDDLADVNAPSPSAGDALKWSGTAWIPEPPGGGTTHGVLSTTHVDSDAADTPGEGDVLTYSSGLWRAEPAAAHPNLAAHDSLGLATDAELGAHAAAADPHPGYRLESADHSHQTSGLQAGKIDHGLALLGLGDDDHAQYLKEKVFGGAASEVPEHTHASAGEAGPSLSPATLVLPSAASPSQTAEGSVVWDSDDDRLTVGTGSGRRTLADAAHNHAGTYEAAGAVAAHEAASNPHGQYALDTDLPHALSDETHTDVDAAAPADGDVLAFDGTAGKWIAEQPGASQHPDLAAHDSLGLATDAELPHALSDETHTDVDAVAPADGDVLAFDGTAGKWIAQQPGASQHPDLAAHDSLGLATDAELAAHAAASDPHAGYVLESLLDAKGDLIAASADNTPARLPVGANDRILMADSAEAAGLKWVPPAAPSNQAFGDAASEGTGDTFARGDHKHGMPADPVPTHATDPNAHHAAAHDHDEDDLVPDTVVVDENLGLGASGFAEGVVYRNFVADQAITAGQVVKAAIDTPGRVILATDFWNGPPLGVALNNAAVGESVRVAVAGVCQVAYHGDFAIAIRDVLVPYTGGRVTSAAASLSTLSVGNEHGVLGTALEAKSAGANGLVWCSVAPASIPSLPAAVVFPSATSPSQTAEGSAVWDSDDDVLTVGDGTSRKTLPRLGSTSPANQAFGDTAAGGSSLEGARVDHRHGMPDNPVTNHEAASDPHAGYVLESLLDAKGDIIVATEDNTPARLAVGTNDQVLTADSTTSTGLKWTTPTGGSSITVVPKTADEAVNNSTTLQDDDHLKFSIGTSGVWSFELVLFITQAGGSVSNMKVAFTVPSGATGEYLVANTSGGSGNWGAAWVNGVSLTSTTVLTTNTTGVHPVAFKGRVVSGGTAGQVTLQWAQNTAVVGDLTVRRGSYLLYVTI